MVVTPIDSLPPSLRDPVGMFANYLTRTDSTLPFLALGDSGRGRGYWIERVLTERGYHPYWTYERGELVPASDLEGRAVFPIYDLPSTALREIPPVPFSVVLVPDDFNRKDEKWRKCEFAAFREPTEYDLEVFLASVGAPVDLAKGNGSYGAAQISAEVYRFTGLKVPADPPRPTRWDAFRAGGEPPVPDGLLPFYVAYTLPPATATEALALLALRRKVPASTTAFFVEAIRRIWPSDEPAFPEILKGPKTPRTGKRSEPKEESDAPKAVDLPVSKGYNIDW